MRIITEKKTELKLCMCKFKSECPEKDKVVKHFKNETKKDLFKKFFNLK